MPWRSLGCTPADVTWRAGVQMLSFGASKNGCLAAEALVFFDRFQALETAERLRKRGGHLYSKMRYISAQLLAYIEDGLWLSMAARPTPRRRNSPRRWPRTRRRSWSFRCRPTRYSCAGP